jgi:hypothetical protein
MLNITVLTTAETSRIPLLDEALQAYERRFGAAPEWLDELSTGRVLSLVQRALQRGVPLIAAELLH